MSETDTIEAKTDIYSDEFDDETADLLAYFARAMLRNEENGSAETWISAAVTHVRWLQEHCDKGMTEATDVDIDDYYEWMTDKYVGVTASGKYHGVQHLYSYLTRKRRINANPAEDWDRDLYGINDETTRQAEALRQKENYISLAPDEVKQLWQPENCPSPHDRNITLFKLLWFTGCRCSEAVEIQLDDINQDECRIDIYNEKRNRYHTVYYPEPFNLQLDDWINQGRNPLSPHADDSPYLFLTHQSESMRASHVSRLVKNAAQNAGLNEVLYIDAAGKKRWKVTGHTIRHSMAHAHANRYGTPIHILKQILDHNDIETTMQYVHDDETAKREAMQQPRA